MSDRPIRLLLGLAPPDEHALEQLLYGDELVLVVAAGANASELLAVAREPADGVLVSPDLPGVDAGTVARLRALGLRTIGIALDASAASTLATLDVDAILEPPIALSDLRASTNDLSDGGSSPKAGSAERRTGHSPGETVLAVVGSKGAPGASEFALSFAALAAALGRVLLAEFDADGDAHALRAGVDPHAGSLLGLARALHRGDRDLEEMFPGWLARGDRGWPQILLGSPEQLAPPELGEPGAVGAVIDFLAARFDLVVCDVGQRLQRSSSTDVAVRLHHDVLVRADATVLVLGTRPDQLQAGFRQLDLLIDDLGIAPERLRIVVSAQPAAAAGSGAETAAAIASALEERQLAVDAWLPWDRRSLRAALRLGQPLALARARGRYARAVRRSLDSILSGPAEPAAPAEPHEPEFVPVGPADADPREVALPWR